MKNRIINYLNLDTGELIPDHKEAVRQYNTGDRIQVIEYKDGQWIPRVTWVH